MESKTRALAKALSWRAVATVTTGLIAWAVTGKLEVAASIGALDVVFKLVEYYLHERLWDRLAFGRAAAAPTATE